LERQGYRNVHNIRGSGDFGVDVIADKDGVRYAIQVKRYRGKVSRRAVSDAVAGKYQFKCDAAMVVTNSYYTAGAQELAASADCFLIDRDTLAQWVLDFQRR
jgi:HJR/Mrr/RecB family endonuclease